MGRQYMRTTRKFLLIFFRHHGSLNHGITFLCIFCRYEGAFNYPFHIGKNTLSIIQHGDNFDLRINNQSFSHQNAQSKYHLENVLTHTILKLPKKIKRITSKLMISGQAAVAMILAIVGQTVAGRRIKLKRKSQIMTSKRRYRELLRFQRRRPSYRKLLRSRRNKLN